MHRCLLITGLITLATGALVPEGFVHAENENATEVAIPDAAPFDEMDQDRDGRLTLDEARQSDELTTYFLVWDTDQNGQLDADEIRAGRNETAMNDAAGDNDDIDYEANFSIVDVNTRDEFSQLDADEDGRITPAEWSESGVPVPFREADQDGDGTLDATELSAASREPATQTTPAGERDLDRDDVDTWEDLQDDDEPTSPDTSRRIQMMSDDMSNGIHFTGLDTDGNGMLDRLEATDNNYVLAHFDEWDVDNNEFLDPDELDQARIELDMQ